ncbi:hypothetical protein FRB91_001670 [Serendipita sp. 411]|nr:hypothetical protein FRC18_010560 [Serendipita sp. 400]KAG8845546.1 hypothetical protein FRB91_001670 [Serendipita sp. 411]
MSAPITKLAQLLIASETKRLLAVDIQVMVKNAIIAEQARLQSDLPSVPNGYVVVESAHTSRADLREHITVDVYSRDANNIDEPIGCLHVYSDTQLRVFRARSKALQAYRARKAEGNTTSVIDLFFTE